MLLPLELIDLSQVTTINVMGKGGKERDIGVLFEVLPIVKTKKRSG